MATFSLPTRKAISRTTFDRVVPAPLGTASWLLRGPVSRSATDRAKAHASGESACACGRPGAVSDPCPACSRVLAAPSEALLRAQSPAAPIVSSPSDPAEREADALVNRVLAAPAPAARADAASTGAAGPETAGDGKLLPPDERRFFEQRFGYEFSQVRVHTDRPAAAAATALDADAFTLRNEIAFAEGRYQPGSAAGRHLIAHELAHVVQQGAASPLAGGGAVGKPVAPPAPPTIQRRLIAQGSAADFASFRSLAEPALGAHLTRDPATHLVSIGAALPTPATSTAFAGTLRKVINHTTQNAEVRFGTHQPGVAVGAFPNPGHSVQEIDMDDILAIDAGAPGNGVAKLAHEINENFVGHAGAAPGTVGPFNPAHKQGVKAESNVTRQLVGPGMRIAEVDEPVSPGVVRTIQDFTNYYLVFRLTQTGSDFTVSNARRAPKAVVNTATIDNFSTGSAAIPGAGAPTIAGIVATILAHPAATVLIQGYADNDGTPASNLTASRQRANGARAALIATGIDEHRVHVVGLGASHFVAPNTTPAGRAQNRRVVITVTEPGP